MSRRPGAKIQVKLVAQRDWLRATLARSGGAPTGAGYALRREKKRYGLVTMCIGGGQGISLVIESM